MIGICAKCGNHGWDKEVIDDEIICPRCGNRWKFVKLPLFILTGCSGVGKTATAMEIIRRRTEVVVLDGDMFYNIMPHETEEDYFDQAEQIGSLSKNLMQTGKPVLWAKAGNLDQFPQTYNSRFFREICCLALVCEGETLKKRMMEGRGITDENWIRSSADYNEYFINHHALGKTAFETFDTSRRTVQEVADYVMEWIRSKNKSS